MFKIQVGTVIQHKFTLGTSVVKDIAITVLPDNCQVWVRLDTSNGSYYPLELIFQEFQNFENQQEVFHSK